MMLVISLALGLGLLGQVHGASMTTTSYTTADCSGDPVEDALAVETFCDICVPYDDNIYVKITEENGMCAYTDSSCSTPDESGALYQGAYFDHCMNGCTDFSGEVDGFAYSASSNLEITCGASDTNTFTFGSDDSGCMALMITAVFALYSATEDGQCDAVDVLWELVTGDCADAMPTTEDPCEENSDDDLAAVVQACGYCNDDSSAKMTTVVVGLFAVVATFLL